MCAGRFSKALCSSRACLGPLVLKGEVADPPIHFPARIPNSKDMYFLCVYPRDADGATLVLA